MSAPGKRLSGGRTSGAACLGLAAAAGLLWWASAVGWYRLALPGRAPVVVDGATAQPWLTAVALLALAGIAAVVATAGVVRRALGGLLAIVGVTVAGLAAVVLLAPVDIRDFPSAPAAPGAAVGMALPTAATGGAPPPSAAAGSAPGGSAAEVAVTASPLLAVGGGVLLAAVGVFVLFSEPRLTRLGARYSAPGTQAATVDPDRAAWAALDEGHDPTADPVTSPRDEPDDPGGGRAGGAV